MFPAPFFLGVLATVLFALLGTAPHVVRAEEVDPARLDACPGYNATSVKVDGPTLTAKLVLAGAPCNVFGQDIQLLDLTVVYESGKPALQRAMMALF
jgi:alpha-glucosidase